MRILFVTHGYAPARGGTERVMQHLAEELVVGHDDEVTVFTTDRRSAESFPDPRRPGRIERPARETLAGVNVRRFPVVSALGPMLRHAQRLAYALALPGNDYLRCWFQGPIVPGLGLAIADAPADVVVTSAMPLLHVFTALRAGQRSGRPVVVVPALHPADEWGFGRPMIDRALRTADLCLAYTPFEAAEIARRGASASRIGVVAPGIDAHAFVRVAADPDAVAATRRDLGCVADEALVGFVGQIAPHKGLESLVAAMRGVWAVYPRTRLLIAGARGTFTPILEQWLSALTAEQRGRVVVVHDFAEERRPALLAALDVLAYPSRLESFGLVFLEAWAAGKPVIGCASGAVTDVITHEHDGLLVAPGDPASLGDAIARLLRDRAWARRLGAAGQRKVMTNHLWPEVARRFRENLSRVASGVQPAAAAAASRRVIAGTDGRARSN